MNIRQVKTMVLAAVGASGFVAGVVMGATTFTAPMQFPGAVTSAVGVAPWAEEPPGCWGPNGVDPDCLGPGPYGHGQWGPTPGPGAPESGPAVGSASADPG